MHDQAALVLTAKPSRLAAGQNRGRRGPTLHEPIMTEARIGRLLAACLHGAIAERLPQRLEFYEHWLTSDGLRDGNIGQAPISAVLGFLRTEGAAYDEVTFRAGELAALWTVASLSPSKRRWIGWLPRTWRARAALRVAAGIIRALQSSSRASTRVRRNSARVEVVSSLFCCRPRDAGDSALPVSMWPSRSRPCGSSRLAPSAAPNGAVPWAGPPASWFWS